MSEIKQCAYCGTDFESEGEAIYCKTKRCRRDRMHEAKERYVAKLTPELRPKTYTKTVSPNLGRVVRRRPADA